MAEERERKKISVLLHDEVAQALAATKMRLDLLRSVPGNDEFRAAVSDAQELLGQSIRQTRTLMTDISNPVLYDMGLQVAVEALAEEVNARKGITVSCSFGGRLRNLGQDMEVLIFQVVKELVQNIVKHSRARNASIRLVEEKNAVRAVVTDDGQGFDTGKAGTVQSEGGFGLFSIRERVKSYGGNIHIKSGPGRGSEVSVNLPKGAANKTASLKTRNGKKGA
jgi:signal transduction histidine kinase